MTLGLLNRIESTFDEVQRSINREKQGVIGLLSLLKRCLQDDNFYTCYTKYVSNRECPLRFECQSYYNFDCPYTRDGRCIIYQHRVDGPDTERLCVTMYTTESSAETYLRYLETYASVRETAFSRKILSKKEYLETQLGAKKTKPSRLLSNILLIQMTTHWSLFWNFGEPAIRAVTIMAVVMDVSLTKSL
jgi:hypothetical protein